MGRRMLVGHPAFISYARSSSRKHAEALCTALGSEVCFLDSQDLEVEDRLPHELTAALLEARVVVAFLDRTYFERWYCLREWMLARSPYVTLLSRSSSESELLNSLEHLVIALPPSGIEEIKSRIPPPLLETVLPQAGTDGLVTAVRRKLASLDSKLSDRLEASLVSEGQRRILIEGAALPQPRQTASLRVFPKPLPPSIGADFVGRENELWQLHALLSEPRLDGTALAGVTGAVQGGGGFGKSRLALEYLHRIGAETYSGGLFWVDASESTAPLFIQFHGILSQLLPDIPSLSDFVNQRRDARDELTDTLHAQESEEPILFVIDNIPEHPANTSSQPLFTWCPSLGQVSCIVTSRLRLDYSGVEALEVDVLGESAAIALLAGRGDIRSCLTPEEWSVIAEWVGRLPMALELLHAALGHAVITPVALLEAAQNRRPTTPTLDGHMEALRGQVPIRALRGITEAFELSFELLSESAKRIACRLAWVVPAAIPDALLESISVDPDGPAARAALVGRSFLRQAYSPGEGGLSRTWQMHRILADFIRTQSLDVKSDIGFAVESVRRALDCLDDNNSECISTAQDLVPAVVQTMRIVNVGCAEGMADEDGVWLEYEAIADRFLTLGRRAGRPSLLRCAAEILKGCSEWRPRDRFPIEWAERQDKLGQVLAILGERLADRGLMQEAVLAFRGALKIRTPNDHREAWTLTQMHLGNTLKNLGDLEQTTTRLEEAAKIFRAVLRACSDQGMEERRGSTQVNLGIALMALGERTGRREYLEEASELFSSALATFDKNSHRERWAQVQLNLGSVLGDIGEMEEGTERLESSIAAYEKAQEVLSREYDPKGWAAIQNNIATILVALGIRLGDSALIRRAITHLEESLEIRVKDHLPKDWATTQDNLCIAWGSLGGLEGSAEFLKNAAAAAREALKVRTLTEMPFDWAHTQTNLATTLVNLGLYYVQMGNEAEATDYLQEGVAAGTATLEVYSRERDPMAWAKTQELLGRALHALGEHSNDDERLRASAAAFRSALEVFGRSRMGLQIEEELARVTRRLGE
jgi:tetratricopeptide (TPR) repeat protein